MSVEESPLTPLVGALADLTRWFADCSISGMVVGGVAASILGRPRATRDVDALVIIAEHGWQSFVDDGLRFGFEPRIADPVAFAERSRVMLLRHAKSGIDVDIALGMLPFEEEAVRRRIITPIAGLSLPLATVEDLLIMKAVAHRHRDLSDIDSLIAAHPKFDRALVLDWVSQFATTLDSPEILADLESRIRGN